MEHRAMEPRREGDVPIKHRRGGEVNDEGADEGANEGVGKGMIVMKMWNKDGNYAI